MKKTIAESFFLMTGITLASLLFFLFFRVGLITIHVLFIVYSLMFILTKDGVGEKKQSTNFVWYRIMIMAFVGAVIGELGFKISDFLGKSIPLPALLFPLACIWFLLGVCLFAKNREITKKFIDLKIGIGKGEELATDSIKLCVNKETGRDVRIKYTDRFLHMLILGPTGSGKTSQVLIPMIWQDVNNRECGVTVLEPKGDLAERVYAMCQYIGRPCLFFNPTDIDCPVFNPLDGREEDVIENITTAFNMLSSDSKTYFKDMTDNLLRKSLMVLKRIERAYTDPETGISERPATLIGLSTLIHNTNNEGRKLVKEFRELPCSLEEKKQNEDTASWFGDEYFAERSKTYENTSGTRSQIAKLTGNAYLRRVLNPKNGKSDINLDKILAEGGVLAITTAQGQLRDLGSYLGYFVILSLQSSVFKRPGTEDTRRAHYLYIDEFQKYSNPGFSDMLTQGRSYRVASHLATQGRDVIALEGGRDGQTFVKLVSSNARNIVLFPGINKDDAKYYSEEFGSKKIIEKSHSESTPKDSWFSTGFGRSGSTSVSEKEVDKAIYSSTNIAYKNFGEITYRIIKDGTVQFAEDGLVSWLDKDINNKLTDIIKEHQDEQARKSAVYEEEGPKIVAEEVEVESAKDNFDDMI